MIPWLESRHVFVTRKVKVSPVLRQRKSMGLYQNGATVSMTAEELSTPELNDIRKIRGEYSISQRTHAESTAGSPDRTGLLWGRESRALRQALWIFQCFSQRQIHPHRRAGILATTKHLKTITPFAQMLTDKSLSPKAGWHCATNHRWIPALE
jgi:hypothetical protein